MKTNVTIKSVRVYSVDDSVRYRCDINEEIDAIVLKDNEYTESKVKYLDFVPSVLIAQCINFIPGLDSLYTKKKESAIRSGNSNGFGAAELGLFLNGAKVAIDRIKFEAGDEYEDSNGDTQTHEYAGYRTNIDGIELNAKAEARLERALDSLFQF